MWEIENKDRIPNKEKFISRDGAFIKICLENSWEWKERKIAILRNGRDNARYETWAGLAKPDTRGLLFTEDVMPKYADTLGCGNHYCGIKARGV